jgi:lipid-binding SYLF domain-containing protein
MRKTLTTFLAMVALATPGIMQAKDGDAADRLNAAADVIGDMMHASDKGVPQNLMDKSRCIVIVPNLKKAGFIVGAKYGRGFVLCRNHSNIGWTAPAAIRIEGGSFGLQIGAAEQDVILLVMNESGMKRLLSDKFTIGGEAAAAAGPVGRDASANTDAVMKAEMLSYSRARGIFGGLTLDGATLRPDVDANHELYGRGITNREILMSDTIAPPPAADRLEHALDRHSLRETH